MVITDKHSERYCEDSKQFAIRRMRMLKERLERGIDSKLSLEEIRIIYNITANLEKMEYDTEDIEIELIQLIEKHKMLAEKKKQ